MLLIQNGILHTMESEAPVHADLLIENGKIVHIARKITPKKGMKVIDAEGLCIYPGFIDAHSHIGIAEEQTTAQTDESNEGTDPVTPFIRAIDGIYPMDSAFHNTLAAGITGVMVGPGSSNPIGGQFAFIKTYGRCVDDMVVLALAAKEGWDEQAALRAITIDAAKICRVDHRLGEETMHRGLNCYFVLLAAVRRYRMMPSGGSVFLEERLAISESYGTITAPWVGNGSLLWERENSLPHVLTHTGSSRSGRGGFQWIAGGGKRR